MERKRIGPDLQDQLVNVRWIAERLGIGVSSVWAKLKQGLLPAPIKLGARTTRWRRSEIEALVCKGA